MTYVRWSCGGWRGWRAAEVPFDVDACLAAAGGGGGRRSRHARSLAIETSHGVCHVKSYPPPDGRRALHAFAMGRALAALGFAAPVALLAGRHGPAGLLVTADAGGEDLLVALARLASPGADTRARKRDLLRRLGAEVARLHAAGFVHGDLVPPNLRWRDGAVVFLDNDRTRRVWLGGRRNLVQLGRFVVPGVTASDRARVLHAYASARGLDRRRRHRLGAWVMGKIVARRCAIDRIPAETAARAGFRALMRSGGPFDPALLAAERA
jgi:Lipopolysaccharide kinase (Kdo/WaaP) family